MNTYYSKTEYDNMKRTLNKHLIQLQKKLNKSEALVKAYKEQAEYWEESYHDMADDYLELSDELGEPQDVIDADYAAQVQANELYETERM